MILFLEVLAQIFHCLYVRTLMTQVIHRQGVEFFCVRRINHRIVKFSLGTVLGSNGYPDHRIFGLTVPNIAQANRAVFLAGDE